LSKKSRLIIGSIGVLRILHYADDFFVVAYAAAVD
jgi:hypothetical protein